jgi:copper transport protein
VLVLLILAVVALWRFTVPPRALAFIPSLPPIALHVMNETTMAMVTISPGQPGPVHMTVVVIDLSGEPVPAEGVTVILTEPTLGIEPLRHVAELADGVWTIENGAIIPVAGIWQVEVDVRTDRFTLLKLVGAAEIP